MMSFMGNGTMRYVQDSSRSWIGYSREAPKKDLVHYMGHVVPDLSEEAMMQFSETAGLEPE